MNRPLLSIRCPECGAVHCLSQAMEDADGQRFVNLLAELSPVAVAPLIRYLKLFKPSKHHGLRWSRMYKLGKELAPMIKAAEVSRNGMVYSAPMALWVKSMCDLVDNPPETLTLPLRSNGYLISVVANHADKTAANQERKHEKKLRRNATTETTSAPVAIAEYIPPEEKPIDRSAAKPQLEKLLKQAKGRSRHE